jgi:PII-like signaling protein
VSAPIDAVLLRIFLGEEERYAGRPLYEVIVTKALDSKMAGATVLYGSTGYGRLRHIRSELNVDAGPRLPMIVEIVDTEQEIERFLWVLDGMIESSLVTMEKVRAIHYRHDQPRAHNAAG